MGKVKGLRVMVEPELQHDIHVKALQEHRNMSQLVRAFLLAWLQGDKRAKGIVDDFEEEAR
jgi:hypothetical protein